MISCRSRGRMALWQDAGWRPRRARRLQIRPPKSRHSTISMIAKIISHGCRPQRGAGQVDLWIGADRGIRRHHQSGIFDLLPAPSRLCRGRSGLRRLSAIIAMSYLAPRASNKADAALAAAVCSLRHPSACRRPGEADAKFGSDVFPPDDTESISAMAWHEGRPSCANVTGSYVREFCRAKSSVSRLDETRRRYDFASEPTA